jgi:group I intron endonuclease
MASVYKITCSVTGKIYVGWTKQSTEKRWQRHLRLDKKCYLRNCISLYGADSFRIEIIAADLSIDEAKRMEVALIRDLKLNICRYPDGNGMNMTDGGEGTIGYVATDDHRKNLSIANMGKKRNPEICLKFSLAKQGEKNPSYRRPKTAKQIESAKTVFLRNNPHKPGKDSHRYGKPSHMRGRKHTDEAKARMSAAQKGKKKKPRSAEIRKQMSARTKAHIAAHGHPMLGKKHNEGSRSKMRASRLRYIEQRKALGLPYNHTKRKPEPSSAETTTPAAS